MPWQPAAVCTVLALLVVTPAQAADEGRSAQPDRFSVDLGVGSHLKDGGNLQSLSFGYTPWRALTLLVNVERDHVPTRRRSYPDGYSVTRGGTLTTVSGELRYTVPVGERVLSYGLVGRGAGRSHPNVSDIFPNRVTRTADVLYVGGGVRVPLRPPLAVFVDAKFLIHVDREGEGLGAMLPIRAGVTWRF
jgi:hypothetical protein